MDYADEPDVIFSPLTTEDYSDFYSLEMDKYDEDVNYYLPLITPQDTVVELGCGTGRLSRLLAKRCNHLIGIDISSEMLKKASMHKSDNIEYLQMDMTDYQLSLKADVIIIPYNSLNLLGSVEKMERCLELCKKNLNKTGKLLFQVYYPGKELLETKKGKSFQFVMLKRPNGDTVIKETLKSYCPATHMVELVERYRDRPFISKGKHRDLEHSLHLYTPPDYTYDKVLRSSGFNTVHFFGDYCRIPFNPSVHTTLMVEASPS